MIINYLYVVEGMYHKKINFLNDDNLICSDGNNSTGKTTLIRLILFAIGYPIPSTKGIDFNACHTEIMLSIENIPMVLRRDNDYITVDYKNKKENYILPNDFKSLQKIIFTNENDDILDNILGVFYIDQDRGWTLLNRGKIVGDIRFNIERLVRGLSNRSCKDLEYELDILEKEIIKYEQMLKVGQYQENYLAKESFLIPYDKNDIEEKKLLGLKIQRKELSKEISRIKNTLIKNKKFEKYIEEMRLVVKSTSGEEIEVTENTLVGFKDNQEIQEVKIKMLQRDLSNLEIEVEFMENELQNALSSTGNSVIEDFDNKISSLPINTKQVSGILKGLRENKKLIKSEIETQTKENNEVVNDLNSLIYKYALELEVDKYIMKDGVFTSNLKSLSGTIYHKIVFIFRLAYIQIVEKYAKLNLPIIIDSPSGREVNQKNIDETMCILKRDFSHHQIIIASIFEYKDFRNANKIVIVKRLIDEMKAQ